MIYDLDAEAEKRAELYDWRADPSEQRDLSEDEPEIARQMLHTLENFYADLQGQSRALSAPKTLNMSPAQIERLKSLGYIRD